MALELLDWAKEVLTERGYENADVLFDGMGVIPEPTEEDSTFSIYVQKQEISKRVRRVLMLAPGNTMDIRMAVYPEADVDDWKKLITHALNYIADNKLTEKF